MPIAGLSPVLSAVPPVSLKNNPAYINGVSEAVFKTGMCLPAGPYVTDEDVHYIVDAIKANIE